MKRVLFLMLLCATLLLTGCAEQKPAMYMEPAKEQPLHQASFNQTYDFRMDDGLKSVVMEVWELVDGQWTVLGGGRIGASIKEGQFALAFNTLPEGVTYSVGGAGYTYTINKDFAVDFAPAGSAMYTTMLTQLQEIAYETPIPMAMQLFTTNQNTQYIGVDFFHQPQLIAAEGHDHVYAVTLTFSTTTME
ncbi:MAG: hypothetical protein IJX84_11770 [Clostridia bacterium]|nr:hypothetical protein [Clostridia bacterium]